MTRLLSRSILLVSLILIGAGAGSGFLAHAATADKGKQQERKSTGKKTKTPAGHSSGSAASAKPPSPQPKSTAQTGESGVENLTHPAPNGTLTLSADSIFAASRPRIFQIRTLLKTAANQSSTGSGFLVDANGLAVTNYHVVSQYALEPQTYRMEYHAPDGSNGPLKLIAIDVMNDLAIVQTDKPAKDFFQFNARALSGEIPQGERLFSLGDPLSLGFTIVEGTYNGLVKDSYQPRIHFTGAINSGMSGGPTVAADNTIVGVNVARDLGGQLVSFLVPAAAAHELLQKARASGDVPMAPKAIKEEIRAQMTIWQAQWSQALMQEGGHFAQLGPYKVPASNAKWIECWARTNADDQPKPRFLKNSSACSSRTSLFIADSIYGKHIDFSYTYLKNDDLNSFAFAKAVSQSARPPSVYGSRKRMTPLRCHEDFLALASRQTDGAKRPLIRATWCLRAYRDFAGLYDVFLQAVTQDSDREALVSQLDLYGVTYENGVSLSHFFLNAIEVKR